MIRELNRDKGWDRKRTEAIGTEKETEIGDGDREGDREQLRKQRRILICE